MGSTMGQHLVKNALFFKKSENLQEIRLSYKWKHLKHRKSL